MSNDQFFSKLVQSSLDAYRGLRKVSPISHCVFFEMVRLNHTLLLDSQTLDLPFKYQNFHEHFYNLSFREHFSGTKASKSGLGYEEFHPKLV